MANRLSPCPPHPNCVSTLAEGDQAMAPLFFAIDSEEAQRRVREVLEGMPRARIVREERGYFHAEFTSRLFRFVDDVEIVVDPERRRIDFRSASRVGHYDFGTNRKRMEAICVRLAAKKGISHARE